MPTLALPATLTHAEVPACLQALAQALSAAGREGQGAAPAPGGAADALLADASALRHFDSSALAVLLEARRAATARGLAFSVQGLPQRLAGLASLYGVAGLLSA